MRNIIDDPIFYFLQSLFENGELLLGILIFGSTARGKTFPSSDLDFVCVTSSFKERHLLRTVNGKDLDILICGRDRILTAFSRPMFSNNNFLLAAFTEGVAAYDPSGAIAQIKAEAIKIWDAGPKPISHKELVVLSSTLWGRSISAQKLNVKAKRSEMWQAIAETQAAVVFSDLVQAYCKVNHLWSSSLSVLLGFDSSRYEEIQHLVRNYLSADNLKMRTDGITAIALVLRDKVNFLLTARKCASDQCESQWLSSHKANE